MYSLAYSGGAEILYINGGAYSETVGAVSFNFTVAQTPALNNGAWRHIAIVYDGTNRKIYTDGTLQNTTAFTTTRSYTTLYIGERSDSPGNTYQGYMQDFRIYKGIAKYTGNFTLPSYSPSTAAGNDSLVDVPVNGAQTDTGVGGEVRGNYGTFNALVLNGNTLTNGNLSYLAGAANKPTLTTFGIPPTGKWYFEFTDVDSSGSFTGGVGTEAVSVSSYLGSDANGWGYQTHPSNAGYHNNGVFTTTGRINGAGSNTIVGVAIDRDAQKIWFSVNGTFVNSGAPASGTNAQYSNLPTSGFLLPGASTNNAANIHFNAGQRVFSYTAPSGFKALCTANLPAPLVTKPSTVFDAKLYTGNGSTQTISGLGFSPDFVWLKNRSSGSYGHRLVDSVRGSTLYLMSHSTGAEATDTNGVTAFNSDGFNLGNSGDFNVSSNAFVAWAWDAGSSTVTNTAGSITSSVRANTTAGFSIVTYTGTGANATVGHGLGVAPSFVIVKSRSNTTDWQGYHIALGQNYTIQLQSTSAAINVSNYWNGGVSSTTFGINGSYDGINFSGYTYVAYCFAPVVGYSAMGSFSGGSGIFTYTGFRPKWLLIKQSSAVSSWIIYDTSRDTYNVMGNSLYPNLSDAEISSPPRIDFVSNGFVTRASSGSEPSWTGTVIYYAVAESPFNYARAR
jgi:hypothetical protein